jgi:hypothetical protein
MEGDLAHYYAADPFARGWGFIEIDGGCRFAAAQNA